MVCAWYTWHFSRDESKNTLPVVYKLHQTNQYNLCETPYLYGG